MFNTAVLPLSVLSDGDQVHSLVARVNALDAAARTDVGVQVEHSGTTKKTREELVNYSRVETRTDELVCLNSPS